MSSDERSKSSSSSSEGEFVETVVVAELGHRLFVEREDVVGCLGFRLGCRGGFCRTGLGRARFERLGCCGLGCCGLGFGLGPGVEVERRKVEVVLVVEGELFGFVERELLETVIVAELGQRLFVE